MRNLMTLMWDQLFKGSCGALLSSEVEVKSLAATRWTH